MKEYQIYIAKTSSKKDTEFAAYNLKSYSLPVGRPIWVDADLYDHVLTKGNLKERVSKLAEREI